MIADLAIIVPTLNERGNVAELVARLETVLQGIEWEAVFVDDGSSDGTVDILHDMARRSERVRYIHRIDRRGLASACIEGMAATSAPYLAVIDADLQHDERLLRDMYLVASAGEADLVVGSRYTAGGSTGDMSAGREWISRVATALGNAVIRTRLSDPMSGFFLLRREVFTAAAPRLSGHGFKILIDLVSASGANLRVRELPYLFRARNAGESKLDPLIVLEYLVLLADKTVGRILPIRFVMFAAVGALGAMLHLGILGMLLLVAGQSFVIGQTVATLAAMVSNFVINNVFTHRDRRLRGSALARGLIVFMVVSGIGALVNVTVAVTIYESGVPWWMAGLLGAIVGAVWNYAVTAVFVWSRGRQGWQRP